MLFESSLIRKIFLSSLSCILEAQVKAEGGSSGKQKQRCLTLKPVNSSTREANTFTKTHSSFAVLVSVVVRLCWLVLACYVSVVLSCHTHRGLRTCWRATPLQERLRGAASTMYTAAWTQGVQASGRPLTRCVH